MAQPCPYTVAIHHLRLRNGADVGSAKVEKEAARLLQDIEWAAWPEARGESWVFIRRVQARGSADQLARELVEAARQLIQTGGGHDVVRFANLTELLAALLTDLVQGQAPRLWYWQRWSHLFRLPLPDALASLMEEHITHLPAVCARLARQRSLAHVWVALGEAGAHQLLTELAWRHGFALPEPGQVAAAMTAPSPDPTPTPLRLGSGVQQRWAPALQSLRLTDPRRLLALALIGQEVAPLMLQRAPATLLAQMAKALHPALNRAAPAPDAARRKTPAAAFQATPGTVDPPAPYHLLQPSIEANAPFQSGRTSSQAQLERDRHGVAKASDTQKADTSLHPDDTRAGAATPEATAGSIPVPGSPAQRTADRPPGVAAIRADSPHPALQFTAPERNPAFDHFHTGQGGLFYLLNFLNRTEAQTLLGDFRELLPSGWGWLYRVGQELLLDETDPVVAFLATQLGFDHPAELELLPPLPARAELLELARCWYGRADLWQPGLLHLTAVIRFTPSHVDMHLAMSAVQLPVRLAGLDINPGWLPWLGRVVTFHYD